MLTPEHKDGHINRDPDMKLSEGHIRVCKGIANTPGVLKVSVMQLKDGTSIIETFNGLPGSNQDIPPQSLNGSNT